MGKYKDLTGQKFERLTVIERAEDSERGIIRWLCQCECGKTSIIISNRLESGKTKSCGCYRKEKTKENFEKLYGEAAKNKLYSQYKYSAKKRGFSFELSKNVFLRLVLEDCYYCGEKSSNIKKNTCNNGDFIYNGIDRIDSSKGYIKGNVIPCCKKCNHAKSNTTQENFIDWVHKTHKNLKSKSL
jgi:hypothetical protein